MSFPVRLLNTRTFEMYRGDHSEVRKDPRYAILSHRWGDGEITLSELEPAALRNPSSTLSDPMSKIQGACKKAREHERPLQWLWMDTCCIDKTNAVEETRSINAMFDWYRQAEVCITYLHDVEAFNETGSTVFKRGPENVKTSEESEWFERGWTLQELLAPKQMDFYDRKWNFIGTRQQLAKDIERVTGIASTYLQGPENLSEASIAKKLSWMAGRVTGQIEDIAYSMIGLLNVNMTPQYGEGRKAFMRLQRTLVETSSDESIFAWTVPKQGLQCFRRSGSPASSAPQWKPQEDRWGLIAPSPDCFRESRDVVIIGSLVVPRGGGGYRWTNEGMYFDLAYRQGRNFLGVYRSSMDFPLNCWRTDSSGKHETVVLKLVKTGDQRYQRERCSEHLETKAKAKPDDNRVFGSNQVLTSPITVYQPEPPR